MMNDPKMAPPNLAWHRLYVRNSLEVSRLLDELQNHPDMEHAEDLGDWVETMSTLMSFRPTTRDDIEYEVRRDMGVLAKGSYPEQEAKENG
jgi:hypothetical protein